MDRLSLLQDDLVFKILSFIGIKDAIGTSVLSSRWRFMWTSIPHLSFSTQDFSTMDNFSDFVANVLSRRNNQAHLSSLDLYISSKDGHDVAQRIMNHAFSLNLQQLKAEFFFGNTSFSSPKALSRLHLSLSSSQTLKRLTLSRLCDYDLITLTSTRELQSLTTLHLRCITLYDGFLSMFPNLENLTLNSCHMMGSNVLRICHPRLTNLTIDNGDFSVDTINVVTPRLKSLTITKFSGFYIISAPELASLLFSGLYPRMFSTDGFHSLEKAELSLCYLWDPEAPESVISLLQKLHNVKVLSLSMEIIQLLNSSVELISRQPSPFANLKSLKLLPECLYPFWERQRPKVIVSAEVQNYLLNSSPNATLTEVPVRAVL